MPSIAKKYLFLLIVVGNICCLNNANAVNWLMLQGVTNEPYPLMWGFLQPSYIKTPGSTLSAGGWQGQQALTNVMQPDLSSSQVFQIQRARVGIRGALPDAEEISYFVLAEYGNNGITQPGGGDGRVTLTDASVTFSHIKGARFRVGQMKIPMSEEIYQGVMADNYINLTSFANQQLIERPFWTDGLTSCVISAPATPSSQQYLRFCNGDQDTQFRTSTTPGSDIGVQLFDSFRQGNWEHSYAVLIGQGGVNKDNRDDSLDNTLYWSSERVIGGQKAMQHGMKLFAWRTQGKRVIYDSSVLNNTTPPLASLEDAQKKYDRKLTGVGATYYDGKYRAAAEFLRADGMLFVGSTLGSVPGSINSSTYMTPGPTAHPAGTEVSQFRTQPEGKGDGGYLDFGYRVKPNIELDVRYDWYNRATNLTDVDEMQFKTWTVGAQYFFSMTTKLIVNYEKRTAKDPNLPSSHVVNVIADDIDNRVSAQVFLMF